MALTRCDICRKNNCAPSERQRRCTTTTMGGDLKGCRLSKWRCRGWRQMQPSGAKRGTDGENYFQVPKVSDREIPEKKRTNELPEVTLVEM